MTSEEERNLWKRRQVDAINDEKVKVSWKEQDGEDAVYLIAKDLDHEE